MAVPVQPLVVIYIIAFTIKATSQSFVTRNGIGPPELRNYDLSKDKNNRLPLNHQAIVTTYKFDCCGNITKWAADVYSDNQVYSLDFQVFRPSPTVDDSTGTGCYSLVGNNRFTSISLSSGIIKVTPSPQDYIMFQPRDVIGFYVRSASIRSSGEIPNGLVLQTSPSRFTSELVWYSSSPPQLVFFKTDACSYSVGHNGFLASSTQAAPVISVDITKFPCDSSTPSQTSPSSTILLSTAMTFMQVDHSFRFTASSLSIQSSTSRAPVIRETSIQPHPNSMHASVQPSDSTSRQPIAIQSMNAYVTVSSSAPPRVDQMRMPWILIGCGTAALTVVLILITTFAVIIVVCSLKRGFRSQNGNQTENIMEEHLYDCASYYGVSEETSKYPKLVKDNHDPCESIETSMNNAYVTNEWNSIEINENVAYDVYARIMATTDGQLYDSVY